MVKPRIGLLGATSLVGECLLPLLIENNWQVTAYSRKKVPSSYDSIEWRQAIPSPINFPAEKGETIPYWISLAPIWVLPDYFDMLRAYGIKRIVALSSTSRFTKLASNDINERESAARLAASEQALQTWAEIHNIEWIVFRPTLIYGYGKDKNITEIARFILRFGFFPLLGAAAGLRQPVHADDIALPCLKALSSTTMINRAYNLSGGEQLPYKEMVSRIFLALNNRPRLISIPLPAFKLAINCMRVFPRFRGWSASMAERMNHDLTFDHSEAHKEFNFSPRPFYLSQKDLPD
ncbi:MAG: NAD-dependent epimerase/dehydratase family protein [Methylosarcina sp.]